MSTVLTLGTFDLFHRGHVELLRRCYSLGARLVVGLNTDEFVERYKARPPVVAYADRKAVLEACRYVDTVVPNDQGDGTILDVLEIVRPTTIAVGSDWERRDYLGQLGLTPADLARFRCTVTYLPYTEGISSSGIRERLP